MSYPILFPYLKGFHLTLSSYLPNRYKEGWKEIDVEQLAIDEMLREKDLFKDVDKEDSTSPPQMIKPVPRFYSCLMALW